MSISPGQRRAARDRGELVEEAVVGAARELDLLQELHHVRVRADHVGDVQERQPHLRRHVVRDGLRERVGHVLLAEPLLEVLVEPPGGLHPRHDHLEAPRVEQDPPQLPDVTPDEVEQLRPGHRRDVALQSGEGSPAALDELDDERRVGLDRSLLAAQRRNGGSLVRERREEVAAVDDGLQRVPDQRIGPREVQHPRAARR